MCVCFFFFRSVNTLIWLTIFNIFIHWHCATNVGTITAENIWISTAEIRVFHDEKSEFRRRLTSCNKLTVEKPNILQTKLSGLLDSLHFLLSLRWANIFLFHFIFFFESNVKPKQQIYEFTSYHSAEKTISLTIFKLHTDRPTSHAFEIVMKIGTLFSVFHCRRPRESIRVIWTECQHVSMTRAPSHPSSFFSKRLFFFSNDQRLS